MAKDVYLPDMEYGLTLKGGCMEVEATRGWGWFIPGLAYAELPSTVSLKKGGPKAPFAVGNPLLELCNRLADFMSCFPSLIFHLVS